jgi:hypothetical protein
MLRHIQASVGKVLAYPGRPFRGGGSTLLSGAQKRCERLVTRSESLWLEILLHAL